MSDIRSIVKKYPLVLALDALSLREAVSISNELRDWFKIMKVGLELFSTEGRRSVEMLQDAGFKIFLDMKLHDIPNTVYAASKQLGRMGVSMLTLHAEGGEDMLRAGVEGYKEGFAEFDTLDDPIPVAVGILTSSKCAIGKRSFLISKYNTLAYSAGCGAITCSALDMNIMNRAQGRQAGHELLKVVPGIRMSSPANDQHTLSTPAAAVLEGGDLFVVGREILTAYDPCDRAEIIFQSVATAISMRENSGNS